MIATCAEDGGVALLKLEEEFNTFIDRMKQEMRRDKSESMLGIPKVKERISWGEAAMTAGIKDNKVNRKLHKEFSIYVKKNFRNPNILWGNVEQTIFEASFCVCVPFIRVAAAIFFTQAAFLLFCMRYLDSCTRSQQTRPIAYKIASSVFVKKG